MEFPTVGAGISVTLLLVLGDVFLLLGCHVQLWCEGFCLALLYFICQVWLLSLVGSPALSLMGDGKGVDSGKMRGREQLEK